MKCESTSLAIRELATNVDAGSVFDPAVEFEAVRACGPAHRSCVPGAPRRRSRRVSACLSACFELVLIKKVGGGDALAERASCGQWGPECGVRAGRNEKGAMLCQGRS